MSTIEELRKAMRETHEAKKEGQAAYDVAWNTWHAGVGAVIEAREARNKLADAHSEATKAYDEAAALDTEQKAGAE